MCAPCSVYFCFFVFSSVFVLPYSGFLKREKESMELDGRGGGKHLGRDEGGEP